MARKRKLKGAENASSEDEWEDVAENDLETSVNIKSDVEVEFDLPDVVKKQQKKQSQMREWLEIMIKRAFNKGKKELHLKLHQTHLVCLLGIGLKLSDICNNAELQSLALSILPVKYLDFSTKKVNLESIKKLMDWINHQRKPKEFSAKKDTMFLNGRLEILKDIPSGANPQSKLDLVLFHLVTYRALGIQARLIISFQPISYKPPNKKELEKKALFLQNVHEKIQLLNAKKNGQVVGTRESECIPQLDGAHDREPLRRSTRSQNKKNAKQDSGKLSEKKKDEDISHLDVKGRKTRERKLSPAKKISKMLKDEMVTNGVDCSEPKSLKGKALCVPLVKVESAEVEAKQQNSRQTRTKGQNKKPTKKTKKESSEDDFSSSKENNDDDGFVEAKAKRKLKEKNTSSEPPNNLPSKRTKKKKIPAKKTKKDAESSEEDFSNDDDDDDDFVEAKPKRKPTNSASNNLSPKRAKKGPIKQTVSPSRSGRTNSKFQNEWIEVYIPKLGWVHLDCVNGVLNDPKSAEAQASQPVHYVIGFDGDGCAKDVTARYAANWMTSTRKLRINYVEPDWWKQTLALYQTRKKAMDKEENRQLENDLLAKPLPVSISAYKDHPLFALRRHLLKYEAIYPPDIPAIGFVRGEEILPRSAVHVLHTREKWLQSALSVKDGEEPYKMVASYLVNKKLNRDSDALSLPLFGRWQTETYRRPVAKDGKVPRNEYGNVDLFQPSMLPIGCVHLRLAGLHTVARKLNIDVSTAIVGFDTHSGYPHPVTDGYVACKEHEAILREAWREEQAHAAERAQQKKDQRIYGNWKKLIRGLQALERVKRKYDKKDGSDVINSQAETAWQAQLLEEARKQDSAKQSRRRKGRTKKQEALPFEVETL